VAPLAATSGMAGPPQHFSGTWQRKRVASSSKSGSWHRQRLRPACNGKTRP